VLFGSYFGNFPLAFLENVVGRTPAEMPNLARITAAQANLAILLDPLQNPMAFLVISLGVGALHLLAGMAVKAYILCRDRKPLSALFDIGSYWLLFAGIITVFFKKNVGIYLIVGGVLAILLTQGRHRKGLGGKLLGGLGGIYSLINYASDLLSYSRVLALGLAAGVIGQVVNILATLKGNSFFGFLLMIVIFVIGHLLNLVINVLGTFVHTARLQYIEFFGKFYEDGGTPFVPLAPSDRYSLDATPEGEIPSAEK
jgi:V/A-type H+-transporting ATPase subunit I